MKIALGQFHMEWEQKSASLERVERFMDCLAEQDVELFLLPEMSLTGFSMNTEKTKDLQRESAWAVQSLAARYDLTVGLGWVKDAGVRCENCYSLVDGTGVLLEYAKIHPFRYGGEAEQFAGGDALPVCKLKDFDVGVQICYDLRFPEPFQILSKKADLILVSACWPAGRREHWNCLLKARAIENMVYVAGVNCAGDLGGQYYEGDSGLYAPDGTLCEAGMLRLPDSVPEERALIYTIQNDVEEYRRRFPVREDRREALYRKLWEETDGREK